MRARIAAIACAWLVAGCAESHLRDAGDANVVARDASVPLDAQPLDAQPLDARVELDAPDAERIPDAFVAPDAGACLGDAPAWDAPFPLAGASAPAFCACAPGTPLAVDAWADARGLFLLVHDDAGATLAHHDGARWITWERVAGAPDAPSPSRLRGLEDGPIWTWPARCSFRRHDEPAHAECVDVPGIDRPFLEPTSAYFDGADRAWVVGHAAGGLAAVDRIRAGEVVSTSYFETSSEPLDVWGDAVGAFVLTPTALIGVGGSGIGARSDVPAGEYVAIWGVDRDELGVATRDGRLLVFDGTRWRARESGLSSLTHARRGAGWVAVAGERAIGRARLEGGTELLAAWTEPAVRVVALEARGDVIDVALVDERAAPSSCGSVLVVRFEADGSARRL